MIDGYLDKDHPTRTALGWAARNWPGMEHVIVSVGPTRVTADSQVILAVEDLASVGYRLECDATWRFIRLDITVTKAGGTSRMSLSVDEDGNWHSDDTALPALEGCIDIDISGTPFTNTLPIRRLTWLPGTPQDLDVAYVSIPDLSVRPNRQRYTLLPGGDARGEAIFRYESGTFRADLPTDGDGFVTDYPGLWDRIWPAGDIQGASA
jgi:uncharacterized protein